MERIAGSTNVDAHRLRHQARAPDAEGRPRVVAMGGYNTFCEILSLDKRGADRAAHDAAAGAASAPSAPSASACVRSSTGWTSPTRRRDPAAWRRAIRALPQPAEALRGVVPGLLDGLDRIDAIDRAAGWTRTAPAPAPAPACRRPRNDAAVAGARRSGRVAVVVKGYPRLSETFIAQEILGAGAARPRARDLVAAPADRQGRAPDATRQIARAGRLPAGIPATDEPLRVLRGRCWPPAPARASARCCGCSGAICGATPRPTGCGGSARPWCWRRELDAGDPAHPRPLPAHARSVVRYAALLTGRTWSASRPTPRTSGRRRTGRSAKSSPTPPGASPARAGGLAELRRARAGRRPGRVALVYHGLDLAAFPARRRRARRATAATPPIRSAASSVGRAVGQEGLRRPARRRWPACPPALHWRLAHIGGGELRDALGRQAERLGLARPHRPGAARRRRTRSSPRCAAADLFVLPCKEGAEGDRDGLPNVIMEAATQALPILSTRFRRRAGIRRATASRACSSPPGDVGGARGARCDAHPRPARCAPARRSRAACGSRTGFSFEAGIARLLERLRGRARPSLRRPCATRRLSARHRRSSRFYAPLKPPDHPVPSGDRTIARLLLAALDEARASPRDRLAASQLRRADDRVHRGARGAGGSARPRPLRRSIGARRRRAAARSGSPTMSTTRRRT